MTIINDEIMTRRDAFAQQASIYHSQTGKQLVLILIHRLGLTMEDIEAMIEEPDMYPVEDRHIDLQQPESQEPQWLTHLRWLKEHQLPQLQAAAGYQKETP